MTHSLTKVGYRVARAAKNKSNTLWAIEKSLKVYQSEWTNDHKKNIQGHLPDPSYEDTKIVYNFVWHTVTFFGEKNLRNPS